MNCIYCGNDTRVTNSRMQKRENHTWRRRQCIACNTVFTTEEAPDLSASIRVAKTTVSRQPGEPFSRDTLFLSIYQALGHRTDALEASGALCATIIAKLVTQPNTAIIQASYVRDITHTTLQRFDTVAGVTYAAYHKPR